MYMLSTHAQKRIRRRHLRADDLAAALDGYDYARPDGTLLFCDPRSRCTVLVNPHRYIVITAFKMKPSKFRRLFGREA